MGTVFKLIFNVNYKSYLPLLDSEIIKFLKNVHVDL